MLLCNIWKPSQTFFGSINCSRSLKLHVHVPLSSYMYMYINKSGSLYCMLSIRCWREGSYISHKCVRTLKRVYNAVWVSSSLVDRDGRSWMTFDLIKDHGSSKVMHKTRSEYWHLYALLMTLIGLENKAITCRVACSYPGSPPHVHSYWWPLVQRSSIIMHDQGNAWVRGYSMYCNILATIQVIPTATQVSIPLT